MTDLASADVVLKPLVEATDDDLTRLWGVEWPDTCEVCRGLRGDGLRIVYVNPATRNARTWRIVCKECFERAPDEYAPGAEEFLRCKVMTGFGPPGIRIAERGKHDV